MVTAALGASAAWAQSSSAPASAPPGSARPLASAPGAAVDPPAAAPRHADPWDWWSRADLTEPIETDRPDFTESTSTVPRGRFQLEGGYTFTYDRERGRRTSAHTAPELLLRAGLLDDLELRVGWEGYTWAQERGPGETRVGRPVWIEDNVQGAADPYFAVKYKVFDQSGLRPDFALIPGLTVPTGSDGFSSGDVDPEVKLAWGYDLDERWSLAGNVNLAVPTDDGRRFFQSAASLAAGFALREDVGTYIEYYGFYPNAWHTDGAHVLNTGLTWQITPNLQLDWRIGAGLNEEADDLFTGIGFALRF